MAVIAKIIPLGACGPIGFRAGTRLVAACLPNGFLSALIAFGFGGKGMRWG